MDPLPLYARDDLAHAVQARAARAARVACLHLGGPLSLQAWIEEAFARDPGRVRPLRLGPLGQALLLDAVAHEAQGPLRSIAGTPGLRRSLQRAFLAAGCANLTPAMLQRAAGRAAPGDSRPVEVARLYGIYKSLLGARLADDATSFRRGLALLAQPPASKPAVALGAAVIDREARSAAVIDREARSAAVIDREARSAAVIDRAAVIDLYGLELVPPGQSCPTQHAVLVALAALSASPGRGAPPRAVRIHLPAVDGRPALEAALQPLQESLYRFHEADLEEVRAPLAATGEMAALLDNLFRPTPEPLSAPPPVTLAAAANPAQEAQRVARTARDLIDHGLWPGDIVIVAQDPARRARLTAALGQYGVSARVRTEASAADLRRGDSAATAAPVQVLLGLYELCGRGAPREALLQRLATRYVIWGRPPEGLHPWKVARALREAGVRELSPGAGTDSTDAERRLREWLRQQAAARGHGGADHAAESPTEHAEHPTEYPTEHPIERPLLRMVQTALSFLSSLPAQGTLTEHARAALRLCARLQLTERACGLWEPAPTGDPDVLLSLDDSAALARDQQAVEALRETLEALPGWAQRLRRETEVLSRERFVGLLQDALSRRPTDRAARPAAVTVCDLSTAAALAAAAGLAQGAGLLPGAAPGVHLFLTGLCDGELPGRAPEDPLLSDDDRRGLNRALGKEVFPLSTAAEARAPLWLWRALAGSAAAYLSYPRTDEDGRPRRGSPWVDAVRLAGGLPEPQPEAPRPVGCPPQELCRTPQELWTRALLARDPAGPAGVLLDALHRVDPGRGERLQALLGIERDRAAWFAARAGQGGPDGRLGAPGPFVGRLTDDILREALERRLPGSPDHPLSASALEDYAKCPFRFFVRRVLKAQPAQEGGDDLDALAGGRLHHAVLEAFFTERRDAGQLPLRGDAADLQAMDDALDGVLRGWPRRERTGHRELFQARVQRLRQDLRRLVEREARQPIEPGLLPRLFEHRFGPLVLTSQSDPDGGLPLHIYGIIDRVDIGPDGRALVLDYKAGRLERYEAILRHELLTTSFQLPLYAAALQRDERLRAQGINLSRVSARYYSLRHGRASLLRLDDPEMISLDPEVQRRAPERNVAEVAYRLWRRLRDGDFRVDPQTCEGCGLEAACRIRLCADPDLLERSS